MADKEREKLKRFMEEYPEWFIAGLRARARIEERMMGEKNQVKREMTLNEIICNLPDDHQARGELARLYHLAQIGEPFVEEKEKQRRSERVQTASRVLEGMFARDHIAVGKKEMVAEVAVRYADALLARIDETEVKG